MKSNRSFVSPSFVTYLFSFRAIMALIHGAMSNFLCPKCLIPRGKILNFPGPCELHTSENVARMLENAKSQKQADGKDAIFIQEGLHDVNV